MRKWMIIALAALMLFAAGCSGQTGNEPEAPTMEPTEPTEPTEPRILDENGDGTVIWLALGDSITQGYYSYWNNGTGTLALDAKKGWAQLVSNDTGWRLANSAVGGSGYVHQGTVLDKLSGREHIARMDFSAAELVTLAFGVNDWKGNQRLGSMDDDIETGGTIYSNMRYCIEKIRKDNPDAEIVVISPLNCTRFGNEASQWGINYRFSNSGTLEQVYVALQEVCDYYGIPLIDLLHNEEINENIAEWFPDGVHPSLEKHQRLAQILEAELLTVLPLQ